MADQNAPAPADLVKAVQSALAAFTPLPHGKSLVDAAWAAIAAYQAYMASDGLTPADAWQDLVEKDDRSSPEEYPEMALITREELADYMDAAHYRTAAGGKDDAYLIQRIREIMEDGDGFWHACSGCQESNEGSVSTCDYPYSKVYRCQPGSGCGECGGIGVIWDDTDYEAYAKFCMEDADAEDRDADLMAWLSGRTDLLIHCNAWESPIEWVVLKETGPRSDRERDIVGTGETLQGALSMARTALAKSEGATNAL